ncbi:MAG: hypothetical protein ACQESK_08300 [Bacteroidota bacterium]
MKYPSLLILAVALIFASCQNSTDPYLLEKGKIGLIDSSTKKYELETIFAEDSIVEASQNRFDNASQEIEIYNKQGELMLILEPRSQDSTATFSQARIVSEKYKTAKGLNPKSSFGDIYKNYKISKIQNSLISLVVTIDELDVFVSIDKNDLPAELKVDADERIESNQIPDDAKIKYFWMNLTESNDENE